MRIEFSTPPLEQNVEILSNGICEEAFKKKGLGKIEEFAFFIYDNSNQIIGGLKAVHFYKSIHVDLLWVHPLYRNSNYGTTLMSKVEEYAKTKQCSFITICTMDFEAKDFYQKLGYVIEFERNNYEKNSTLYYLKKNLQ